MFTTIEGEWDEVMGVIKRAVEAVAERASDVSLTLRAELLPGQTGALAARTEHIGRLPED